MAQWFAFASRLGVLLDRRSRDDVVTVGEIGGEGAKGARGFSRNLVASDVELTEESSGDIRLSRSKDFGSRISGDLGEVIFTESLRVNPGDLGDDKSRESPLDNPAGRTDSLF